MSTTWDDITGVTPAQPSPPSPVRRAALTMLSAAAEEFLTFGLTFIALIAAITSIERADWVPEMPDLGMIAAVSFVGGWILARTRFPAWMLQVPGVLLGVAYATYEVMQALRLATGAPDTLSQRWEDLWTRNVQWYAALRDGSFSTDPIPFVLMVVVATWGLAYLAAWAVARWRNPWLALMPGAIALLTNISYLPGQPSAELIVFLFASVLLFARLHMLRAMDRMSADATEMPLLMSLEVLHLATWVGVLLIVAAWIIPTANHWGPVASAWQWVMSPVTSRVERFGELFIGVNSKRSIGLHTFEGVLPLQGSVTLGNQPLMTVSAQQEGYLRGAVYDQYTSNGWKLGATADRPFAGLPLDQAAAGTVQTRSQLRQPLQAAVRVDETFARRRVFAFGELMASDEPGRLVFGGAPEDVLALAPTSDLLDGADYQTVGNFSVAPADRLITASPDYPAWVRDRYLQLPPTLPNEVRILSRQVAGDERVPYKVAVRVEDYLRRNYAYSLDIGQRPPHQDAVQFFLFDRRQGYSDYFASAMVVMLRSLGVPSRVAVGFALSDAERDPVTKEFVVTDQQSWVWPQVYFPNYGWVDFNPTPSRAAVARPGDAEATSVPDSGLPESDLLPVDPDLDLDIPVVPGTTVPLTSESAFDRFVRRMSIALLAIAGVVVVFSGVGRLAWDTPFRRFDPATRRWAKLQTLAAWAGVRLSTDRTPMEEAVQLGAAVRRPPLDLRPLARAYVRARYGQRVDAESPDTEREMDLLYLQARSRLMKRALSRFFSVRG